MSAYLRIAAFWIAAATGPWLLQGCGEESQTVTPSDTSRPVKTLLIAGATGAGVRNFPARIDAAQRADLAFRVSGTVAELLVKEGDRVAAGQLVARLEPKDFQIVVNDRQATFDNAKKNYDRAKGLVESGAISRMDFDRLEAEFKSARAALEAARQDLAYTELAAPFGGVIAKRQIQQFEEVQAKQAIVTLQNVDQLEVKFDIPEALVRRLRAGDNRPAAREGAVVAVSFDGMPGRSFPLTFKEVATKADAKTQTFEVTYTMQQPEQHTVLPGMTANVMVDLSAYLDETASYQVPVSAVVGDYKLDPQVWVVDPDSLTTRAQPVQVGRMSGASIEVTAGLKPGMRIVTAGAAFVSPGMKVSLMPEREQAEPRASDPL